MTSSRDDIGALGRGASAPRAGPGAATDGTVEALVRASLAQWGHDAGVRRNESGALVVSLNGAVIIVTRAPAELPFRWLVSANGRERAASSVTGLLRILRSTLDPGWRPSRARIAALTPPPA